VSVVAIVIAVVAIVFGRGLTFKATQEGDVSFILKASHLRLAFSLFWDDYIMAQALIFKAENATL